MTRNVATRAIAIRVCNGYTKPHVSDPPGTEEVGEPVEMSIASVSLAFSRLAAGGPFDDDDDDDDDDGDDDNRARDRSAQQCVSNIANIDSTSPRATHRPI